MLNARELPRQLCTNPGVRAGLLATLLLVTGHFTAYTFVRPVLQDVSRINPDLIGVLLLGYGVAGVVGNFVAGALAARRLRATLFTIAVTLAAAMTLISVFDGIAVAGITVLTVWGLAYGGVSVSLQSWMLRAAPRTAEAASALFVATFNLSIAAGAVIGGVVIDSVATTAVLWVGTPLVLLAVAAMRGDAH